MLLHFCYATSSTNFLHFLTWQLQLLQYISLTFIFSSPYYSIHLHWNCSFSSYFFYFDFSSPHFIYYKNLPFLFSFNIQSGKYSLSLSLSLGVFLILYCIFNLGWWIFVLNSTFGVDTICVTSRTQKGLKHKKTSQGYL